MVKEFRRRLDLLQATHPDRTKDCIRCRKGATLRLDAEHHLSGQLPNSAERSSYSYPRAYFETAFSSISTLDLDQCIKTTRKTARDGTRIIQNNSSATTVTVSV